MVVFHSNRCLFKVTEWFNNLKMLLKIKPGIQQKQSIDELLKFKLFNFLSSLI